MAQQQESESVQLGAGAVLRCVADLGVGVASVGVVVTSLRMRVAEAGARAFVAHMMALSEPDNLTLMDEDLEAGEAALDAMLDCFTENVQEWQTKIIGISHALAAPSKAELNRALQALREDR